MDIPDECKLQEEQKTCSFLRSHIQQQEQFLYFCATVLSYNFTMEFNLVRSKRKDAKKEILVKYPTSD